MTPDQQLREALDLGLQVWRTTKSSQRFHEAFVALDRLVAERDEAQAQKRSYQQTAHWADQARRAAEGREAALREALERIAAMKYPPSPWAFRIREQARAALAGVPVDEGGGS